MRTEGSTDGVDDGPSARADGHGASAGSSGAEQPPPERPLRAAAFFDLDKTIIATSSATAFSRPFLADGLLSRRDVIRTAYAQFLYLVGGADADQTERLRAQLARTVVGWEAAHVATIVEETLHASIDAAVYAEAVALIEDHHAAGRDVVIVSASGEVVVRPIAAVLGADHVIASRLAVVDGRYTGEIDFYAYGENKAAAMRDAAERYGYDLAESYAYSDSVTDAPMLAAVGHGFAVNPDRALRRRATEEGWGVLAFDRPLALRSVLRPTAPVVTGLGVTLTVAVVVVLWRWWVRSRRLARGRAD